jgi:mercuric ion transport protein
VKSASRGLAEAHRWTEKLGTTGAVIAALACPICFPKLALVGTALGLGIFAPYEKYVALGVQALFVMAFVGQALSYRTHRNNWLLGFSGFVTVLVFVGYYVIPSSILLQVSLAGLVIASIWQVVAIKRCAKCAMGT